MKKLRESREALTAPAPGTTPWKELLSHGRIDPEHPRPAVNDLAAIQYTSGTTGRPKGAMLTHFNLYSNALQGEAWMQGAEYRKEIFYAILPMFHAFGMTLYLTYGIRKQGLLVLFPKFDPDLVLDAMKKSPATVYCAVPPIYERTAMAAKEKGISLRSCKYCISGAMNLPDHVVELWESVSGGLLVEGYGMTESSPVALGNPFHPTRRNGTIGVPFPSTLMKVVDLDDPAVEVPPGQPGELLLKGPQVFQGYWNNPEETAKTLTADGWLRTGDVVTVDDDGFTTIVDRAKELIITGGFNVSPTEVESVLRLHPDVRDAAVVGKPLERGGELVVAAVELEPGADAGRGRPPRALPRAPGRLQGPQADRGHPRHAAVHARQDPAQAGPRAGAAGTLTLPGRASRPTWNRRAAQVGPCGGRPKPLLVTPLGADRRLHHMVHEVRRGVPVYCRHGALDGGAHDCGAANQRCGRAPDRGQGVPRPGRNGTALAAAARRGRPRPARPAMWTSWWRTKSCRSWTG